MPETPTQPGTGTINRRYLQVQDLRRLRNLVFSSKHVVEGQYAGRHASPQRGHSVEFNDYREYTPGDEIGDIDWKVFGRSDKLFIKNVTRLPSADEGDDSIRVKIEFASGRSDEVIVQMSQIGTLSRITHVATARNGKCLWRYEGDVPTPNRSWSDGGIEVLRQQSGTCA